MVNGELGGRGGTGGKGKGHGDGVADSVIVFCCEWGREKSRRVAGYEGLGQGKLKVGRGGGGGRKGWGEGGEKGRERGLNSAS